MGDAPSCKAITDEENLSSKFYWRMGSHCYTLNYDGSLNGESLPFNDIAITIKLSIPNTTHKQKHKIKIGMRTSLVVDEFGNLLDSELEPYMEEVCIGGPDTSSLKKYEDEFNQFFNGKP